MSERAGIKQYRLFKRKIDRKGKRRLYYARILDPETGRIVHTVSTKETSYVRAVRWMDRYLQRERDMGKENQTVKNIVTVEELSRGFWEMDAQYARGRLSRGKSISHGYLDISKGYTRNHIIPVWGSRRVNEITVGEIDKWIIDLYKDGEIAGATINKILQCFRTLLDGAVKDGHISSNPASTVKPVKVNHRRRGVLTNSEVAELLGSPSYWKDFRHYTINLLAFSTGMRIGEIRGLLVEHVHPDHVAIVHSWEEGYGLKEPKFGSVRAVPIFTGLFSAVQKVVDEFRPESIVFYSKSDKSRPMSKSHIENIFYDALVNMYLEEKEREDSQKRAKALQHFKERGVAFHSWRHKLNSVLRSHGVPDSKIRLLTGHKGEAMTDWYTKFQEEDYADVLSVQSKMLPTGVLKSSTKTVLIESHK